MRRLTNRHDRVLDDLRGILEDSDGETWPEAVEDAMNTTWDALLAAGDPGETGP